MDYFGAQLELKTVDVSQRLLTGYAAAHHNIDRVRDIIDPGASAKATGRLSGPSDVAVFIGHNSASLPVGIPQVIQATPQGLYTETYILKGPVGDNLLAVARDLMDHGQSLGMSIGYKTHDSRHEHTARGKVRRILDYELKEFSFAAAQAIANPMALVSAVKALSHRPPARPEAEQKGPGMQDRVEQQENRWLVSCDADADGDEDDNRLVGTYDSAEMANAVVVALRQEQDHASGDQDSDDDETAPGGAKTSDLTSTLGVKSEWSTAQVNDLPNSAFLYVEPGEDDQDGKRVPRSKRHFPVRGPDGKIDLPHLRNAIARIPQSNLPDDLKSRLQARARRMLANAGEGGDKTYEEPEEWKSGAPLSLYGLGCRLQDLSEQLATELKAMLLLGEETKGYQRIRPQMRDDLRSVAADLGRLLDHAETIDRGEDGRQRLAWLKQQLALTEV